MLFSLPGPFTLSALFVVHVTDLFTAPVPAPRPLKLFLPVRVCVSIVGKRDKGKGKGCTIFRYLLMRKQRHFHGD